MYRTLDLALSTILWKHLIVSCVKRNAAKSRKQNRRQTFIVHRTRIGIVGPDRMIIAVAIDEVGLRNVNGDDRRVVAVEEVVPVHRIDVVRRTISTVTNGNGTGSVIETAIAIETAMEGEGTAPVRTVPVDRGLIQDRQPPREENHRNGAHVVPTGSVDREVDPNHLKTEDMVNTTRIEEKNAAMTIVVNIGTIERDRPDSTLTIKATAAAEVTTEVAHVVVAAAGTVAISHTSPGAMIVVTRKGHRCRRPSTISTATRWDRDRMSTTTMIHHFTTACHRGLYRAVCHHTVYPRLDTMRHRLSKRCPRVRRSQAGIRLVKPRDHTWDILSKPIPWDTMNSNRNRLRFSKLLLPLAQNLLRLGSKNRTIGPANRKRNIELQLLLLLQSNPQRKAPMSTITHRRVVNMSVLTHRSFVMIATNT